MDVMTLKKITKQYFAIKDAYSIGVLNLNLRLWTNGNWNVEI